MKKSHMRVAWLLIVLLSLPLLAQAQNWPSFRGANASGNGDGNNPPAVWDAEKGTNVLWKTEIPGLGHSSPVVWGERVFVTTAISTAAKSDFVHGLIDTGSSADDTSMHAFRV